MPILNINYQNTIIYKIVCNDLNVKETYVGSTTNFKLRKTQHKKSCNDSNTKEYNQRKYQFIRDNGGWDNWSMIEIEKYPCNDSNESRARERYHYELLNSNLNDRLPKREIEEKKQYNNNYFREHKETLKEKRKEYRKNPEVKDHENERMKEYYRQNKDIICKRQKEKKSVCECGSIYRSRDRSQHLPAS